MSRSNHNMAVIAIWEVFPLWLDLIMAMKLLCHLFSRHKDGKVEQVDEKSFTRRASILSIIWSWRSSTDAKNMFVSSLNTWTSEGTSAILYWPMFLKIVFPAESVSLPASRPHLSIAGNQIYLSIGIKLWPRNRNGNRNVIMDMISSPVGKGAISEIEIWELCAALW